MPARLLDAIGGRTVLVVGKGGLGKTTTAGALALALADAGIPTHLASTDPAHSLGDLFDQRLPAGPARSRCTDRLVLEEIDGPAVARRRLDELAPALREIIDRGTYLDLDDADSLLAGTLPGLDEIGAGLRLAQLANGERRLVVDTAPMGHTLRLLDVPRSLRAWIRVFRAMATKADAVATALLGAQYRQRGEVELDRLEAELDRFGETVGAAAFLLLTGPGRPVLEATRRLRRALEDRELRVAATVAAARPGAEADVLLPVRPDLRGCDRLRGWLTVCDTAGGAGPVAAPAGEPVPGRAAADRADTPLPPGFPVRPLLVITGKGGVGKTTCAAALAAALSGQGPVVLAGHDPSGSLDDVIPDPPPGLTAITLDAEAELERFRRLYREEMGRLFEHAVGSGATLDREVMESLWALAPPGIDELTAVARLAESEPAEGRLILDTAPTGHFLRLVGMPGLALDWVHRIMRILLKLPTAAELDGLAALLIRLAQRLRALRERLADPASTAIILVTLDQPLVLAESHRLAERLRGRGLAPAAVLMNRVGTAGMAEHTQPVSAAGGWDAPVFAAPEIDQPTGTATLRDFARRWRRVR